MPAIDRAVPYVKQLLENDKVHSDLEDSLHRARQAYSGARGQKSTKSALSDSRVRRRVAQSVGSARDAVLAGKRGREKELRRQARRRRIRVLLLAGVAAGAAIAALNAGAPEKVLARLGNDPTTEPSTTA
jgi:hypothetical protein